MRRIDRSHNERNAHCRCQTCEYDSKYLHNVQLEANLALRYISSEYFEKQIARTSNGEAPGITHWMPLPRPPQEKV